MSSKTGVQKDTVRSRQYRWFQKDLTGVEEEVLREVRFRQRVTNKETRVE